MSPLPGTPSQTVGPYLAIGLRWPDGRLAVAPGTPGAVWLRGRVLDGAGTAIPDALVETWQADPVGRFDHPDDPRGAARTPGFRGFGRSETLDGEYAILTVKPGALPTADGGTAAPHVDVSVFSRGLLDRVVTRLYFADEPQANAADPLLASLDPERRATLLAQPDGDGYRFDIVLQGTGETVFLDV
ncbi:MAG: pcaG [Mycobacterium sp.]|jgi:protocatechuate 3,4-dioxygenase alpha subunit|nr:pcaG [Mycobacterium sp.]MCW2744472.1 pcaG [Mycobacterium sp.]